MAKQSKSKFKALKQEIDGLTKELKDKEWASKKTNEGIKILYKELEDKNKKLKKIDQLKSQFVSNVAHEFKTPLVIARNCINLILGEHEGALNSGQKDVLKRGLGTLARLIRLVTDLLDLARIESGKMAMKREEVDIASLLAEVFTAYEDEISKKQITFKKQIAEDAGLIWADKDKINEVIINLLSNAIKYTPSGGHVTARLEGDEKKIRFEITDSGPGIAKQSLTKIFDKFERVTAEKEEGTGLGLPIAKDIIRLHKGRLWVESPADKSLPACPSGRRAGRQGSKFIFTLPRSLRKQGKNKGRGYEEKNTYNRR